MEKTLRDVVEKNRSVATAPVGAALCVFLMSVALLSSSCRREDDSGQADGREFSRLMNLGKAHLENRNSKEAIKALSSAVQLGPNSAPALRNLARAHRIARSWDEVIAVLDRAHASEPGGVATAYLRGLAHAAKSAGDEAVRHFEASVRLDPDHPVLRFQLARAYETVGQHEKAVEQLHATVELDPLHASAQFKLVRYARLAGDTEEFQSRNREFLRLRKLFGDETRTAEALEACEYTRPESALIERTQVATALAVQFVDATDEFFSGTSDRTTDAAAVIDVDGTASTYRGYAILAVDSRRGVSLLSLSPSGAFTRSPVDAKGLTGARFDQCAVGNFHDDVPPGAKYDPKQHARNDVLLRGADGLRLLKRTGPQRFEDVTESAGLGSVTANRARWVDYEHDGDLDLLLAQAAGVELWQNNGDGRFENVTELVGLERADAVVDVLAIDLDDNVAMDIVAAHGRGATVVFENQRAGRFARVAEPPGPWPAAERVLGDDLNQDGYPDVVLFSEASGVVILSKTPSRPELNLAGLKVSDACLIDVDNDGLVDVCAVGSTRSSGRGAESPSPLRLYRNEGEGRFEDVTGQVGLGGVSLPALRSVAAADLDEDGDTDLMLVSGDRTLHLLRNEGGHRNRQLKIRLTSLKTNTTGIGTHIALREGPWWVTRSVGGFPIEIGVGERNRLDSVQTAWTNGVVDNQVDVEVPPTSLELVEKNVAAGSCPFLYAWDGRGYRFVTDLLGNSPIGLPLSRDVMLPADVDEFVFIGTAEQFPAHDGWYRVVVTDEFREVLYLDEAKLVAVDHPGDREVHPTDKLMPPPFPTSAVWSMDSRAPLRKAMGSDGIERTGALRELDGVFAASGALLRSPYRGMCHPLTLDLDFGPLEGFESPVLAMTGWLQYGDASVNIAMSQDSSLTIIRPTLEVETAEGEWRPIDLTVGMPAGKTKTILCDLSGQLPTGARHLRLSTTFEIRWDRIALFDRADLPASQVHAVVPGQADLQWRGFSEIRQRGTGHPTTPVYDMVNDQPPWHTTLQGWCTRYGDVLELVSRRDDRLVLVNSGDGLTLSFDAAKLPPIPEGLRRSFFFYSVGWDKDGDYNVVGGDRVAPLPTSVGAANLTSETDEDDWRIRYNTRWVAFDRFRPKR